MDHHGRIDSVGDLLVQEVVFAGREVGARAVACLSPLNRLVRGSCQTWEQEFGCYQVFESAAHTLECCDVFRAPSSLLLSAYQFMEIRRDVIGRDRTFLQRNQELSHLRLGRSVGVDDHACTLDRMRVSFAGVGLKGSHEVEVRSRTQVVSVEEWS